MNVPVKYDNMFEQKRTHPDLLHIKDVSRIPALDSALVDLLKVKSVKPWFQHRSALSSEQIAHLRWHIDKKYPGLVDK